MCRKYILDCETCGPDSHTKITITVDCHSGQHYGKFDIGFSSRERHPVGVCPETKEVGGLSFGALCRYCYNSDGRPDPDPKLVKVGEQIIRNLTDSDSILVTIAYLAAKQANFRVENEERKEFNRIFAAVEAYFTFEMRTHTPNINMLGPEARNLFMLLLSIMCFNIVADEEDKHGNYTVEERSLPPLLKELTLSELAEKDCNICREEIGKVSPEDTMETAVRTPCGHIFGNICILTWLQDSRNPTCPICRSLFSIHTHQFPEGYEDSRNYGDIEGIPHNWYEILMDAAAVLSPEEELPIEQMD